METETLFSSTRWEIISTLSQKRLSPIELAAHLKTTSANISQQLRLLELAGLVKSEKTSNTDKGKPRVVYSLVGDNSYLVLTGTNFAKKKMFPLDPYHNFMLKSFFLENPDHHVVMAELYFKIKDVLQNIDVLAAESGSALTVYVLSKKQVKVEIEKVRIKQVDIEELKKRSGLVIMHDPNNHMGGVKDE